MHRFTSLLIDVCPGDTIWHWALRAWRFLCTTSVPEIEGAADQGGAKKKSKLLALVPASFQDIEDWGYDAAQILATRAIVMGMQVPECARCVMPLMCVFLDALQCHNSVQQPA